jgi:hypothetical protein
MSRARVHEVSSPISLFPFIGILLCTMAALLVILIAVSRSARDTATRQVADRRQPATTQDGDSRRKFNKLHAYVNKLKQVESDAQRTLREDQLRLSHVEDHIRRLQEKLRSAQMASAELEALEEEHYDDRQQAEREVRRLRQLIAESEQSIASLKEQAGKGKRSYALMPYEGPNGTFRRPIYVECVQNALILQPEGVEINRDQLRPPYGPGNPLAAALRAAREHLIRLYPNEGQSRDLEPYPLLLVRPEGLLMYNRARKAIEGGDFDFGYELVETDWKLKYPAPDPALAVIEQQAIKYACARQEVLAAAAPRAYRNPMLAGAGEFEFDDDGESAGGGPTGVYVVRSTQLAGDDDYSGDALDGEPAVGRPHPGADGGASARGGGHGNHGPDDVGASGDADGYSQVGNVESGSDVAGAIEPERGVYEGKPPEGATGSFAVNEQRRAGFVSNSGEADVGMPPAESGQAPTAVNVMTGSPPRTAVDPHGDRKQFEARGKDWALGRTPARAVPVQRMIHVIVRQDRLAILSESGRFDGAAPAGEVVPMKGDTIEAVDEFVAHVRKHVDGWGMAGNGLYWRPVLLLSIGPNADRRASDLARLLKNSGLEIRYSETARNTTQGEAYETR